MIAYYIRRSLAGFRQPGRGIEETDNALRTYGLNDGKGPAAGQVFRNPDLARTFRLIAEGGRDAFRSEEHTSELQSLMRISYAVFGLKKKNKRQTNKYEQ